MYQIHTNLREFGVAAPVSLGGGTSRGIGAGEAWHSGRTNAMFSKVISRPGAHLKRFLLNIALSLRSGTQVFS